MIRLLVAFLALALASETRAANQPPLPRPRPPTLAAPSPAQDGRAPGKSGTAKETGNNPQDQDCLERLGRAGVVFEPAAAPKAENPGCVIETPVRLKSVASPAASPIILLPDEPLLSCRFAERFGSWLRDAVAPIVTGFLTKRLKSVRTGPGYECRNRNRAAAGKLSAHSTGLAADVSALEITDQGWVPIKPGADARVNAAVDAFRHAGCGWFTTVLGPGSDAAHPDHIHVDILPHGSSDRYRICE